ncbi:hypothetical protein [Massilia sp. CFBP9026]|nr:hypothetical protein [Massilia sp. CFBP9026]
MKIQLKFPITMSFIGSLLVFSPVSSAPKDPVLVGMAFLDIITDVVTRELTQKSYIDYQHQRYRLLPSERFPAESHALSYDRPLCKADQDIEDFLDQKCKIYQVVEAEPSCKVKQKNCIALELSPFVARDTNLISAISKAFDNVREFLPDPEMQDKKYGIRDLQTPGLILSPHGQWATLGLDTNRPYKGVLKQLESGVFVISFN